MLASGSHGRLLKHTLAESCLSCTKRRRLSVFQAWKAAPAIQSSFFFANARWQNLQTRSAARVWELDDPRSQKSGFLPTRSMPPLTQRDLSLYKPNPPMTLPRLLKVYSQLSKSRLTTLVVLTAMSGVALSPLPATVPVLLSTALGTALCAASANTLNQLVEVPFDAQMARTRMRPLVRGAISPAHATGFAIATGIVGPAILLAFANPVSAFLGAANIGLYAVVYTRLKRSSIANTWIGAVVGGLPPLIGWTACGGKLLPSAAYPIAFFPPFLSDLSATVPVEYVDNPLSALALFCLLFSWQFPHFNSLAHIVRDSYAQGGYKMLPVINPSLNTLVSLRHATALVAICSVLTPLSGLTTWTFAMTSLIPNAYMVRGAWRFWRKGTEKEAKALWNISLWYLPVILGLMMFHKQGMEWLTFLGWKGEKKAESAAVVTSLDGSILG